MFAGLCTADCRNLRGPRRPLTGRTILLACTKCMPTHLLSGVASARNFSTEDVEDHGAHGAAVLAPAMGLHASSVRSVVLHVLCAEKWAQRPDPVDHGLTGCVPVRPSCDAKLVWLRLRRAACPSRDSVLEADAATPRRRRGSADAPKQVNRLTERGRTSPSWPGKRALT